ncbi:MAG: discoidin domain-containing protein [Rivularia sp. (in: cyanobacteria)]
MHVKISLKFSDGDFERGFGLQQKMSLVVSYAEKSPKIEIKLPPAPSIPVLYQKWKDNYIKLANPKIVRIKVKKFISFSYPECYQECEKIAVELRSKLNQWLSGVRSKLESIIKLDADSEVIFIIYAQHIESQCTKDILYRLPWGEWDYFSQVDYLEAALCLNEYESNVNNKIENQEIFRRVRITSIFGESEGINLKVDQELIGNLSQQGAELIVLSQPKRPDLIKLWHEPCDILFYSGHSYSEEDGKVGFLQINQQESLNLEEIRNTFREAIKKGLKIAFFNSCDGLGLAQQLADLNLPLIIVWREPVADKIAQRFLEYFLSSYANGKSLFTSVRDARIQLVELADNKEKKLPGVKWLPIICQNTRDTPPTWEDLGGLNGKLIHSPYQGLSAFSESDQDFFFGRDDFIRDLVKAVNHQALVPVIGASGSGKSSVVFAGLLPQLRNISHVEILSFRPGKNPFDALAVALSDYCQCLATTSPVKMHNLSLSRKGLENRFKQLELGIDLHNDQKEFGKLIDSIVNCLSSQRFVLIADQFEELYTLAPEEYRQPFLDTLLYAVKFAPRFTLVLTLRADFYGHALSYRPFSDALQSAGIHNLAPMNSQELYAAIEKPAHKMKVELESGLTAKLIDDLGKKPGRLPLLEFTLSLLWDKHEQWYLTHQAYQEIGGLEKALAKYADSVLDSLSIAQKEQTERIFIQLISPGKDTEDTKRVATSTEVGASNWNLVKLLADKRLVITGWDKSNQHKTVEIIHEALIREWGTLRLWIEINREFRIWQERLKADVREWESKNYDSEALLQGTQLAIALDWYKQRRDELTCIEQNFISASVSRRDKQRRQQKRRRQLTISGLIGGLILVSTFAFISEIRRIDGEISNISRNSQALFVSNQEFEALIESIGAGKKLKQSFGVSDDTQMQVIFALQQAIYGVKERNRLQSGQSVSFSPDGKILASVNREAFKLWNLDGREIQNISNIGGADKVFFAPEGNILALLKDGFLRLVNLDGSVSQILNEDGDFFNHVSFSSQGKMLASFNSMGIIKIWSLDGRLLKQIKNPESNITSISISTNGQMIASASIKDDKNIIKIWSIDGSLIGTIINEDGSINQIQSISFSPDGKTIASLSMGTVKLWEINGKNIDTFKPSAVTSGAENSVIFSPNGEWLAVTSGTNSVNLWKIKSKEFITLEGHGNTVVSKSFSPDSQILASADINGKIKLWHIEGRKSETVEAYNPAFSQDGKIMAAISNKDDKTVQLFRVDGSSINNFRSHQDVDIITGVSISPDGKTLAYANINGTITKINIQNGRLIETLNNENQVLSLTFSPDSKLLISNSNDHTVKLWNTNEKLPLKIIRGYNGELGNVTFSPDGKMFALIADNGNNELVQIWKNNGTLLNTLSAAKNQKIFQVTFSPDGKKLILLNKDSQSNHILNFYNLDGNLFTNFPGCRSPLERDSFSPDGNTIAFACQDNTVKLWNFRNRKLQTFKGHNTMARSISFSPDGRKIASIDAQIRDIPGTVKIWSRSGKELQTFKSKNINHLGFNPNGKFIVFKNFDHTVTWQSLDLDELMLKGCDWLDDYLKNNPDVSNSQKHICDFTQNELSEHRNKQIKRNKQDKQVTDTSKLNTPTVQETIQLPTDSSDLARNKPVKASGYWQNATPESAVDNRVDTAWGTSESTGAWMYVDLGNTFEISRVIAHWGWDSKYGASAQSWIEVSNDAQNWRKVAGSTMIPTAVGKPQTLKFPSVKARYVRFYAARWNGAWGYLKTMQVYQD